MTELKSRFDVFLCHNSQDKPEVKEIARQLQARGLKPWLDEWESRPGHSWQDLLEEQIEEIGSVAVFVGKSGIGPWQERDWAFLSEFVRRECPVIPVLLENVSEQPKLPIFLSAMTWVDFRQADPDPMERLIWGITGEKPTITPSINSEVVSSSSPVPPKISQEPKPKLLQLWFLIPLLLILLSTVAYFNRDNIGSRPAEALFEQGKVKYDAGDKQGAIADYDQAIKLNPDDAKAYNNRGIAKYDIGDKKGAIADYNQAIKLKPDYAAAYNNRGIAKYDLGDNQGAIAEYTESIRLNNPELYLPYYNRGNAKSNLGDKQGAIADYQTAAELYQQQGKTQDYQDALNQIKKLQN